MMNEEVRRTLDMRLARGEITADEYTKTLDLLAKGDAEPPAVPSEPKQEWAAGATPPQPQKAFLPQQTQRKAGCGTWVAAIFILTLVIGLISEIGGCDGSGTGAWKDGYDTGIAAGKVDGYSSRIIPSEDSVERTLRRCLLSSGFANASADERDQWERGFMSGYKTGFKEVTKPVF